jgi:hypothetical protein
MSCRLWSKCPADRLVMLSDCRFEMHRRRSEGYEGSLECRERRAKIAVLERVDPQQRRIQLCGRAKCVSELAALRTAPLELDVVRPKHRRSRLGVGPRRTAATWSRQEGPSRSSSAPSGVPVRDPPQGAPPPNQPQHTKKWGVARKPCSNPQHPLHCAGQPIVEAARIVSGTAPHTRAVRAGPVSADRPPQGSVAVCYLCWSRL